MRNVPSGSMTGIDLGLTARQAAVNSLGYWCIPLLNAVRDMRVCGLFVNEDGHILYFYFIPGRKCIDSVILLS